MKRRKTSAVGSMPSTNLSKYVIDDSALIGLKEFNVDEDGDDLLSQTSEATR